MICRESARRVYALDFASGLLAKKKMKILFGDFRIARDTDRGTMTDSSKCVFDSEITN
jgi:hypothetical protein